MACWGKEEGPLPDLGVGDLRELTRSRSWRCPSLNRVAPRFQHLKVREGTSETVVNASQAARAAAKAVSSGPFEGGRQSCRGRNLNNPASGLCVPTVARTVSEAARAR
jgi:hypothetical protein